MWVSLVLLCLSPLGAVAAAVLLMEEAVTQALLLSVMLVISTTQAVLNVLRWRQTRASGKASGSINH
ncbi:hypothetical protein LMG31887_46270 (plasmid) [Xanthomonas hydrangeae]|nr:hypothetical protein LMG31887_46270 [Xanthomonas hydrangeae]CAD7747913.1 hypothetical protein LMG31887_46270 [Xanthomonas hydrangeae]